LYCGAPLAVLGEVERFTDPFKTNTWGMGDERGKKKGLRSSESNPASPPIHASSKAIVKGALN
jgi:hypothetical protein